ncbi:hypothetical protein [Vreelandella aquamarina]|uniref:hypothetical protein n=1 Tax=Vreelandella aquamarina TaxID=77097 RepID=UPI001D197525|nr:hypothetical protein [Halomonas meridiana]MCC4288490.1 hypothetical protein [Halomonas meridiana]
MTLSIKQRAQLRAKGIVVRIEYGNGSVKCSTAQGDRYYTAGELKQLAKPGFFDRLTALMGVRHAAN